MNKLDFTFDDIIKAVANKSEEMENDALEKINKMKKLLANMPAYTCPATCNNCCHGSILMSYVEYVHLLRSLREEKGFEAIEELFSKRLGVLEEGKLLCPLLNRDKNKEHCSIYEERPLICRVFGTSSAPCDEDIAVPDFAENLFYRAYQELYYTEDGSFIGLPITDEWAMYKAPFAIWAIADSEELDSLLEIFWQHGSFGAVICDLIQDRFFTLKPGGEPLYLDTISD